eukprot:TRINITY_DN16268_c0_g1_i1.p1 TRINITY_DN16268_c0_g1~~TRINITY_DN16268_c0_g1_i1.p1  ORF type:complete len:669 (+),score=84.70 TRINITY_DN16268_c0_g1_i1:54-2009(+)
MQRKSESKTEAPAKRALVKIITLGTAGVGKTSFLNRFVNNKFSDRYKATIGADFMTKEMLGDRRVMAQLWDTAGQERFQSLGTAFYRGAEAAILIYSTTKPESADALQTQYDLFIEQVDPSKVFVTLVGMMYEPADSDENLASIREKTIQKADKWLESHKNIAHFKASAKTGEGVSETILYIMKKMTCPAMRFIGTSEYVKQLEGNNILQDYIRFNPANPDPGTPIIICISDTTCNYNEKFKDLDHQSEVRICIASEEAWEANRGFAYALRQFLLEVKGCPTCEIVRYDEPLSEQEVTDIKDFTVLLDPEVRLNTGLAPRNTLNIEPMDKMDKSRNNLIIGVEDSAQETIDPRALRWAIPFIDPRLCPVVFVDDGVWTSERPIVRKGHTVNYGYLPRCRDGQVAVSYNAPLQLVVPCTVTPLKNGTIQAAPIAQENDKAVAVPVGSPLVAPHTVTIGTGHEVQPPKGRSWEEWATLKKARFVPMNCFPPIDRLAFTANIAPLMEFHVRRHIAVIGYDEDRAVTLLSDWLAFGDVASNPRCSLTVGNLDIAVYTRDELGSIPQDETGLNGLIYIQSPEVDHGSMTSALAAVLRVPHRTFLILADRHPSSEPYNSRLLRHDLPQDSSKVMDFVMSQGVGLHEGISWLSKMLRK